MSFALCAFVSGTIGQEFVRGAGVRRSATGSDFLTAMIGLVARSRRRYGGYIVHVGIVLMALGFAGQGYKVVEEVLLRPGQQIDVGRYRFRHDAIRVSDDGQKQMVTGHLSVFEGDRYLGDMTPARWFFRKHETEPTTEVAIRRSVAEDLYIVMAAYEIADQSASYQITINPLVNWIWIGFSVLALGTGIALLPESAFAFAAARVPSGAATASLLLLALALLAAPVRAQGDAESLATARPVARSPLEKQMQRELVCLCGDCPHYSVADCTCPDAARMRRELAAQVEQGQTREEIIDYFVALYGSQEVLGAPIDRGFNRLAWLFPYLLGASGAAVVALSATRWSKRGRVPAVPPPAAHDARLEARLDDELRDLD